ncbi:hypothetical protein AB6A40_003768 [Gnathostoma spinigerum]|uniref:Origin recognition complex subunit 5 C-terminal domain-containing protein n=1 Tax=Gnathostoma spinigerum TaxID=75299 RepID=A0ABD6EI93_9BILA
MQFSFFIRSIYMTSTEADARVRRVEALLQCSSSLISHIHLYGHSWSTIVDSVNEIKSRLKASSKALVVTVNCALVHDSTRSFCRELYRQIAELSDVKVDNIDKLRERVENFMKTLRPVVLVLLLYHAESLWCLPSSFLKAFFELPKWLSQDILKILTVSQLPFSQIETTETLSRPIEFSFPCFSRDEILQKIRLATSLDVNSISPILDTVYITCRDPKLIERMIEKLLKTSLPKLQKSCSVDVKVMMQLLKQCSSDVYSRYNESTSPGTSDYALPLFAKYLLIAAYCASNNPSASDRRFFSKNHTKQKKSKHIQKPESSEFSREKGPKGFDLQRLFFLYRSLLEQTGNWNPEAGNINVQINDLCAVGSIIRTSADGNLDQPKYKCAASYESIVHLSKSVGVDVGNYLFQTVV